MLQFEHMFNGEKYRITQKKNGEMEIAKVISTFSPIDAFTAVHNESEKENADYPQASEPNEFRFLSPKWLNEIATGLTTGAKEHPGETWRTIPATEHAWRAIRHLIMFLMGDQSEPHLINASMRVMMAYETAKEKQHEHR